MYILIAQTGHKGVMLTCLRQDSNSLISRLAGYAGWLSQPKPTHIINRLIGLTHLRPEPVYGQLALVNSVSCLGRVDGSCQEFPLLHIRLCVQFALTFN